PHPGRGYSGARREPGVARGGWAGQKVARVRQSGGVSVTHIDRPTRPAAIGWLCRHGLVVLATFVVSFASVVSSAGAVGFTQQRTGKAAFDARQTRHLVPQRGSRAFSAFAKSLGVQGVAQLDPNTRTPRQIAKLTAF